MKTTPWLSTLTMRCHRTSCIWLCSVSLYFVYYQGVKLTPPLRATVTTVREQGSEKQQAYWMPKILNYDIIGCYAQTELGHGSNVRGLECTATYDSKKKEFELHSPYLTSSKWWNGSMGRTATHAVCNIVWASVRHSRHALPSLCKQAR